MPKTVIIFIRLIPILMQILGLIGFILATMYSASMILGAGIGSPTGEVHESYYVTASWMMGVPGAVFLIGWIWVTIGFLRAPVSSGRNGNEKAVISD